MKKQYMKPCQRVLAVQTETVIAVSIGEGEIDQLHSNERGGYNDDESNNDWTDGLW